MNSEIQAVEEAQDIIYRHKQRLEASLDLMESELFKLKMRIKGRIEDELDEQARAEVKKLVGLGCTEEQAKIEVFGKEA